MYACGRQKALTMPAYCVAANCNNSQAAQKHNYARIPAESTRFEAKMGQICTIQTSWLWCCASVTPICVMSTLLSAISLTLWRNTKWGLLQNGIYRALHRVTDLEKIPVRISKDEADEQQAHSMIPKIERYTDTPKQALKARTKSLTRKPTAEEAVKERDCTQMPVAKKERTPQMPVAKKERPNHKCWWRKMAA